MRTVKAFLRDWSMLIVFAAMFVILAVVTKGVFLQKNNLLNLLSQNALIGVLAIGQFLVILTGGIDLSVGSMLMVSSIAYVYFQQLGVAGSMAFAVFTGAFFGVLNGLSVTKFKINAFITTLASMQIARGIGFISVNGQPIFNIRPEFLTLGSTKYFQVSAQVYIWLALVIVGMVILNKSRWGVALYCTGGSRDASRLSGIKTDRVILSAYALSGALCGVGGILYTSRLALADPTIGGAMNMDSITAVVIGGASLAGGQGKLFNTIIGVLVLGMLNNFMNIIGISSTMHVGIKGFILVVMVLLNNATLLKKDS
ncbi:ribose ABC transporter permease [Synergistales bacterium]|nr:ribose ABC transporter permease [Synergistales bacterium]